jgi:hypothetical protein
MQPKPIDSKRLLDIDRQRRIVDMEGFASHLRGVQGSKENPAETDYDAVHDEESHRDAEEIARESVEKNAAPPETPVDDPAEADKAKAAAENKAPAEDGKGARLDVEA